VRLAPPPGGARGVYLLPAAELIDLAETAAGRPLTDEECQTYLHQPICLVGDDSWGHGDLAVLTATGLVSMEGLADEGTVRTSVRVVSQLPADLAGALTDYAAGGPAISIVTDDGTVDVGRAVEEADVAILVRPGDVAYLDRAGSLIGLDDLLSPASVATIGSRPLATLGQVKPADGADDSAARLVGAPFAATASGVLWYPARAFAAVGYEPPTSWGELEQLVAQMIEDGHTPWCLGLAGGFGGAGDGSGGADLLEDLVLGHIGGRTFDRWPSGGRAFALWLEAALRQYHAMIHEDGAVLGGPETAVTTPATLAALQMGSEELPRCWLVHAAADQRSAWEQATWKDDIRDDLTPVRFPIAGQGSNDLRGRVYTLVVLRDRPEVRDLVRHLLGAEFASRLVAHDEGSGLVPLTVPAVPVDRPPDERVLSNLVTSALAAGVFRADASDQMTRELGVIALPESALRIADTPAGASDITIASELDLLERVRLGAQP
jgi:alpha-glucoside transport system substrate-binding protein